MIVLKSSQAMRDWSRKQRSQGRSIGFVPTMGFLHEGHLCLVDDAKSRSDKIVLSIFVNPTQFGPNEDLDSYPRDEKRDLQLCEKQGVDVVFFPSVEEMYPKNSATYVIEENLGEYLCGASRPVHFRGVTTIVTKLFNIVDPDIAVFGQKDAQQARIIEQMTEDLRYGIEIIVSPIVRENDGLAKSSRNVRLTPAHRKQAPALKVSLNAAYEAFISGEKDSEKIKNIITTVLSDNAPEGIIDYIEIVDWHKLRPIQKVETKSLLAVAVKFGSVRLIDNILLEL
jgi:pantoate--beta-alanine ligase